MERSFEPRIKTWGKLACILLFVLAAGWYAQAQETNHTETASEKPPVEDVSETEKILLQLQERLHQAALAIDKNRQEAETAARRNAEVTAERLKLIEQTITTQREGEVRASERIHESNRLLLIVAGAFAGIGLLTMLFTGFVMLRSMNRLAEATTALSAQVTLAARQVPGGLLVDGDAAAGGPSRGGSAPGELLDLMARVEQRAKELERAGLIPRTTEGAAPANGTHAAAQEGNGEAEADSAAAEAKDRLALILGKAQSLLSLDQAEAALACYDEALALEPDNAEVLVKKGTALERLKRLDAAIECYDRAIALNDSMTLAYLHKGGIYNQLERFNEALQCYEQALRTQQKPAVS